MASLQWPSHRWTGRYNLMNATNKPLAHTPDDNSNETKAKCFEMENNLPLLPSNPLAHLMLLTPSSPSMSPLAALNSNINMASLPSTPTSGLRWVFCSNMGRAGALTSSVQAMSEAPCTRSRPTRPVFPLRVTAGG